ncbi:MAG: hypothetical protein LBH32_14170, partial [Dysgonamonadaceae bacterium]|nr:hypothetical protein [Dysgonamonadaceae bacterium]
MNRNYLRGRIYWTGCIECFAKNSINIPVFILSLLMFCISAAGQDSIPTPDRDNIYAKSRIVDKRTIKLRWSPANPKAWSAGKKYGY